MSDLPGALLITPELPSPNGSGLQQRAFRWLTELAREHTVSLLVADSAPPPESVPQNIRHLAHRVDFAVSHSLPSYSGSFSRCVVFRLRMHSVAEAIRQSCHIPHVLLDMDDLESATLRSIAVAAARRGRLRLAGRSATESLRSYMLERRLPPRYQAVCLANPEDLRRIGPGLHAFCVPNIVPFAPAEPMPLPSGIPTLAFIGTFSYFPNEDAALWIATAIVPRLRTVLSQSFRILIAGRYASTRLRSKLASVPEIEFLGEISSVEAVYKNTHLSLAPLRCGGGTKLKALEAIAHHRPIVATPQAMRGLNLRSGTEYLSGSTAQEVASACAALLLDPARAATLARAAYQRLLSA